MEGCLSAASPWLFFAALFSKNLFSRKVVLDRPRKWRQPRKWVWGAGCVWKRTQALSNTHHSLLWCWEDFRENSQILNCAMWQSVSEHWLAWMQGGISASCLNGSRGEAVWSGLIYGWLKYTVIKIRRHRLVLKNIRYGPTGTWKAPNCDAQTNTKNFSNCAQLGLFLQPRLHLYGWLAAF